jgi:alpha-ketoglutarate-dependent taurine dioxygenase
MYLAYETLSDVRRMLDGLVAISSAKADGKSREDRNKDSNTATRQEYAAEHPVVHIPRPDARRSTSTAATRCTSRT